MRQPIRILAFVGALAVVVLGAVILRGSFGIPLRTGVSATDPSAPGPPAGQDAEDEDMVDRALRLAAIESSRKSEWVDEIPDLDLAALAPAARETFTRIANGRRCTCGCGFTLAGCRRFDSDCEASGPRASALYDSVRAGRITSAKGFRERPESR